MKDIILQAQKAYKIFEETQTTLRSKRKQRDALAETLMNEIGNKNKLKNMVQKWLDKAFADDEDKLVLTEVSVNKYWSLDSETNAVYGKAVFVLSHINQKLQKIFNDCSRAWKTKSFVDYDICVVFDPIKKEESRLNIRYNFMPIDMLPTLKTPEQLNECLSALKPSTLLESVLKQVFSTKHQQQLEAALLPAQNKLFYQMKAEIQHLEQELHLQAVNLYKKYFIPEVIWYAIDEIDGNVWKYRVKNIDTLKDKGEIDILDCDVGRLLIDKPFEGKVVINKIECGEITCVKPVETKEENKEDNL